MYISYIINRPLYMANSRLFIYIYIYLWKGKSPLALAQVLLRRSVRMAVCCVPVAKVEAGLPGSHVSVIFWTWVTGWWIQNP